MEADEPLIGDWGFKSVAELHDQPIPIGEGTKQETAAVDFAHADNLDDILEERLAHGHRGVPSA